MPSHYVTPDETKIANPDDRLSIWNIVMKYQLHFTKHFGPSYAYGVSEVEYTTRDNNERIVATARVRAPYQSTKGTTCQFDVPYGKFLVWRKNVKLYDFIS